MVTKHGLNFITRFHSVVFVDKGDSWEANSTRNSSSLEHFLRPVLQDLHLTCIASLLYALVVYHTLIVELIAKVIIKAICVSFFCRPTITEPLNETAIQLKDARMTKSPHHVDCFGGMEAFTTVVDDDNVRFGKVKHLHHPHKVLLCWHHEWVRLGSIP